MSPVRFEAVSLRDLARFSRQQPLLGNRGSKFVDQLRVLLIESVAAAPGLQADDADRELPLTDAQVWVRRRTRLQPLPRLAERSLGCSLTPRAVSGHRA